jgi:hypothetical protein
MARKIQQTAGARPNKSAFVRSLSFDMPSADVIARARAKGMELTRNDVHAIRAIARRKRGTRVSTPGAARTARTARPVTAGRGRAAGGVNKSAFVRSLPASLSAAEVIEKGKAKGIKLSAAQVYTIRANARRKAPEKLPARLLRAGRGDNARAASAGGGRGRGSDAKEAEFIAAALDLGLARAEALIRALRARASSGWS